VNALLALTAAVIVFFAVIGVATSVAWVRDTYRLGKEIYDRHD
jgi:hypothetical protein